MIDSIVLPVFRIWIWSCFKAPLFVSCCRCDGPAEGAAFRLPGHRSSYTSRAPQQQASQPGTHLQALEMEEKEKREAEANGK